MLTYLIARRAPADAYYRVISYVVAKVVADIPAAIISALSYSAILYPSVGLHHGAPYFFFFALTTFVTLMVSTLIGCAQQQTCGTGGIR